MAACDHNIIWFVNGQPQLQLEGDTCLKVNPDNSITTDYSTRGIQLLNGCTIYINRDCELYEIQASPDSLDVFQPAYLKQYIRKKNKKYMNDDGKPIIFLNPYQTDDYYEEKYNYTLRQKISHFLCPVEREKKYRTEMYYYYDTDTFMFHYGTTRYNAIFICDLKNNYSLVGLGGYGHEYNPYLHFMSRGYGDVLETAISFECYRWLINDIFFDSMHEVMEYEFKKKPLNIINKIPYGFSLKSCTLTPSSPEYPDDYDAYWRIDEAIQTWINKFSEVYTHSRQWEDNYNAVMVNKDTCLINSATFWNYNRGEFDLDEEDINKLPKNTKFIIELEEEYHYIDMLKDLKLKPHSNFVYTKKQILQIPF